MNQANEPLVLMTRLQEEHRDLEQKLAGLTRGSWLTPAEEVEVRRLKRLKLSKKDQIQLIAARLHRS